MIASGPKHVMILKLLVANLLARQPVVYVGTGVVAIDVTVWRLGSWVHTNDTPYTSLRS